RSGARWPPLVSRQVPLSPTTVPAGAAVAAAGNNNTAANRPSMRRICSTPLICGPSGARKQRLTYRVGGQEVEREMQLLGDANPSPGRPARRDQRLDRDLVALAGITDPRGEQRRGALPETRARRGCEDKLGDRGQVPNDFRQIEALHLRLQIRDRIL